MSDRETFKKRIEAMISAFEAGEQVDPLLRDALIDDLAAWQATRIVEYGRLERRGTWPPALPTDVFRFRRIAAHPPEQDVRVFRSSGTTSSERASSGCGSSTGRSGRSPITILNVEPLPNSDSTMRS